MRLRNCVLGGILAASIGWTPSLEAQAPRVDSSRVCVDCGKTLRANKKTAYRIFGADRRLLFMSPADTSSDVRSAALAAAGEFDESGVESVETVKAVTAATTYGKAYADGVLIVTLNQKGTAAWLKAAAARAAKPASIRKP